MHDSTDFDTLLHSALMDANLRQYQTTLDTAENLKVTYSPNYLRQRTRLLADPKGWMRRRARPVWEKALRTAACFLLACTIAFGSLMAASPTARAAVVQWFRTVFAEHSVVIQGPEATPAIPKESEVRDENGTVIERSVELLPAKESTEEAADETAPDAAASDTAASASAAETSANAEPLADSAAENESTFVPIEVTTEDADGGRGTEISVPGSSSQTFAMAPTWVPANLPDGWSLWSFSGSFRNDTVDLHYSRGELGDLSYLDFYVNQNPQSTKLLLGLEESHRQEVLVNGQKANYYEYGDERYLLWSSGSDSFRLANDSDTQTTREDLIRIAENIQKAVVTEDYAIHWMPETYTSLKDFEDQIPSGRSQTLANAANDCFFFTYAAEKAGPLAVTETTPEAVTVNGCAGIYWVPEKPGDHTRVTMVSLSEADGTKHKYYGYRDEAFLTWTNAQGVTFSIRGSFDKDVLLKMAESVSPD